MQGKHLSPDVRRTSFDDAFVGRTLQWAVAEASRCLQCEPAPCREGCLADVDVRRFVRALRTRNVRQAAAAIREANPFVATCGRVCPQGVLCEARCNVAGLARPIAIGELQRFVGEAAIRERHPVAFPEAKSRGEVAVVGGGPAGLAAAYFLRREGIVADLLERRAALGGVPAACIPRFRLPARVLEAELAWVVAAGVRVIQEDVRDPAALRERYRAVFLACGLGEPARLGVPGEELDGVAFAEPLLEAANGAPGDPGGAAAGANGAPGDPGGAAAGAGARPRLDGEVVVIGGGNTAFDAATVALRLGAARVTIAYRRSEAEMPAWAEHRGFALEEGVEVGTLLVPVELRGEGGHVTAARFLRAELGPPDASGRRRPVPVEGAFVELPCRHVILALGRRPPAGWPGARGEGVDPATGETAIPGVYAGGDLVSGGATVVRAVAEGRRAARAIAARLRG